jgi:hypothetical protein
MDREIKVTKCGEQEVCGVNDRISIEFTPFEVIALTRTFRLRTLAAKIQDQDNEREMHDVFLAAREMWGKRRKKRNEIKEDLLEFEKDTSVLPLLIGNPNEPPSEIITCTSISGVPSFVDNMPIRLTLVRKLASGECYTAFYRKMAKKRKVKDK